MLSESIQLLLNSVAVAVVITLMSFGVHQIITSTTSPMIAKFRQKVSRSQATSGATVLQETVRQEVKVLKAGKDDSLIIAGEINHVQVEMLFDTGATANVISQNLAAKCNIRLPALYGPCSKEQITIADGSLMKTSGYVRLFLHAD
ncbi:MAG: hypothetical protein GY820_10725 [Gammaproteobacteria bacterium]|nr:hypothetical protein [Gammaproteobacteria bacterium]